MCFSSWKITTYWNKQTDIILSNVEVLSPQPKDFLQCTLCWRELNIKTEVLKSLQRSIWKGITNKTSRWWLNMDIKMEQICTKEMPLTPRFYVIGHKEWVISSCTATVTRVDLLSLTPLYHSSKKRGASAMEKKKENKIKTLGRSAKLCHSEHSSQRIAENTFRSAAIRHTFKSIFWTDTTCRQTISNNSLGFTPLKDILVSIIVITLEIKMVFCRKKYHLLGKLYVFIYLFTSPQSWYISLSNSVNEKAPFPEEGPSIPHEEPLRFTAAEAWYPLAKQTGTQLPQTIQRPSISNSALSKAKTRNSSLLMTALNATEL